MPKNVTDQGKTHCDSSEYFKDQLGNVQPTHAKLVAMDAHRFSPHDNEQSESLDRDFADDSDVEIITEIPRFHHPQVALSRSTAVRGHGAQHASFRATDSGHAKDQWGLESIEATSFSQRPSINYFPRRHRHTSLKKASIELASSRTLSFGEDPRAKPEHSLQDPSADHESLKKDVYAPVAPHKNRQSETLKVWLEDRDAQKYNEKGRENIETCGSIESNRPDPGRSALAPHLLPPTSSQKGQHTPEAAKATCKGHKPDIEVYLPPHKQTSTYRQAKQCRSRSESMTPPKADHVTQEQDTNGIPAPSSLHISPAPYVAGERQMVKVKVTNGSNLSSHTVYPIGGAALTPPKTRATESFNVQHAGEFQSCHRSKVSTEGKAERDSFVNSRHDFLKAEGSSSKPEAISQQVLEQGENTKSLGDGESSLSVVRQRGRRHVHDLGPTPVRVREKIGSSAWKGNDESALPSDNRFSQHKVQARLIAQVPGLDWESRKPFDIGGQKRADDVKQWTSDQCRDPPTSQTILDTNHPDFLTGIGIAQGDTALQAGIEVSLHDVRPDTGPVSLLKRNKTAQHAIEERLALQRNNLNTLDAEPNAMSKEERRAKRLALQEDLNRRACEPEEPNEHRPEANIYMRPVEMKDAGPITEIYNQYIETSTAIPYLERLDARHWREIIEECEQSKYPFIVAILTHQKIKHRSRTQRLKEEPVVGFAWAVDYGDGLNAYRFSAELDICVHPRHVHKGIGKTLLDRMMFAMSPVYGCMWKDPVPFIEGKGIDRSLEVVKEVKTISVTILYRHVDEEELKWKQAWMARYGFTAAGNIPNMAHKFGKSLGISHMYHDTGRTMSHVI